MSFKIKQRELDEMTDRIAFDAENWQDVAWILSDYLPLDIFDAVADWDVVTNSANALGEWEISLSDDWSLFMDKTGREWMLCTCGQLDCRDLTYAGETHIAPQQLVDKFGPITRA